jgi:hypothetical protein
VSKTITLKDKRTGLVAGIKFTDGTATVNELGPHLSTYFERIGATISGAAAASPEKADEQKAADDAKSKTDTEAKAKADADAAAQARASAPTVPAQTAPEQKQA